MEKKVKGKHAGHNGIGEKDLGANPAETEKLETNWPDGRLPLAVATGSGPVPVTVNRAFLCRAPASQKCQEWEQMRRCSA